MTSSIRRQQQHPRPNPILRRNKHASSSSQHHPRPHHQSLRFADAPDALSSSSVSPDATTSTTSDDTSATNVMSPMVASSSRNSSATTLGNRKRHSKYISTAAHDAPTDSSSQTVDHDKYTDSVTRRRKSTVSPSSYEPSSRSSLSTSRLPYHPADHRRTTTTPTGQAAGNSLRRSSSCNTNRQSLSKARNPHRQPAAPASFSAALTSSTMTATINSSTPEVASPRLYVTCTSRRWAQDSHVQPQSMMRSNSHSDRELDAVFHAVNTCRLAVCHFFKVTVPTFIAGISRVAVSVIKHLIPFNSDRRNERHNTPRVQIGVHH